MKNLVLILLIFVPFLSQGQHYPNSYLSKGVSISEGTFWLQYREHDNTQANSPSFFQDKIEFSPNGVDQWLLIYDKDNESNYTPHGVSRGDAAHQRRITFTRLPGRFFEQKVYVRLTGKWGTAFDVSETITVDNSINNLTSVSATDQTYCNLIQVTWAYPQQDSSGTNVTSPHQKAAVFLSTNSTASPDFTGRESSNITHWNQTGMGDGTGQTYDVYSYLEYPGLDKSGNVRIALSDKVTVTGKSHSRPVKVTSANLDNSDCNGDITINWTWGTTNPDHFLVRRSTNSNFNPYHDIAQVNGTDRTFKDQGPTTGGTYYYRVFARETCAGGSVVSHLDGDLSDSKQTEANGIPPATSLTSAIANAAGNSVTVNWTDNTLIEDGFTVVRDDGVTSVDFDVPANTTSYTDASIQACKTYTYSIKTYNSCRTTGVLSNNSKVITTGVNTAATFDTGSNKIDATDGEFGDRIVLKWNADNRLNDDWIINRINPLIPDTTQIANLAASIKFFTDNTANANTLYEYEIQGGANCITNYVYSNTSKDVGFRLAFGTVNGQVTYTGGVAVEGVKITAQAASGASGMTAEFNGTSSYATANNNTKLQSDELTIQSYINLKSLSGIQPIVDKSTANSGYRLFYNNGQLVLWVAGYEYKENISLSLNQWVSVTATVSNDSVKLFSGSSLIQKFAKQANTTPKEITNNLIIGKSGSNYLNGLVDELRIYDQALSNIDIQRSVDVYINPSASGLVGYWRFDEGFGNSAYDYSKTLNTPNKNHASLTQLIFSTNKPTTTQLSPGAYTDSLGSYFIPFIPYLGSGDNYIITPQFSAHRFSPATTSLLIGTGSQNSTGVDFDDLSSFNVSGTVKYKDISCAVEDAILLIDGEVVVKNGEIAQTAADGSFNIQVPIGPHVVTVKKSSHEFSAGRFPAIGTHDFQQNISGIQFEDSTKVRVVGRVAGGSIQKSLPPGLGRGKNNIGVATIEFELPNQCTPAYTATTDLATGEYFIDLPPMFYNIKSFNLTHNASISFNASTLDLTTVPSIKVSRDSVFKQVNGRQVFDKEDTAVYQTQKDFIKFNNPTIEVFGKNNPTQYGTDKVTYKSNSGDIDIPTSALNLNYQIFNEVDKYTWEIHAFEVYNNFDANANSPLLDRVPMKEGNIEIVNNLATEINTTFEYKITDTVEFNGIQEYTFQASQANTAQVEAPGNVDHSFTKTCEISLLPDAGNAVSWKPDNGNDFRGIIFGGRSLGNSFLTDGPQVVTTILRDPPGSNSYATWATGETQTLSYSFGVEAGIASQLSNEIKLGTEFEAGLGYSTKTKIEAQANADFTKEMNIGAGGEWEESTTTTTDLSTSSDVEFVSADGDIYYGRSMNMNFGLSEVLQLVESANCNGNCSGPIVTHNSKNYRIGVVVRLSVVPDGYETQFAFTQAAIENIVIPNLELARNSLLETPGNHYTSKLNVSDPKFGSSNDDDKLWAGNPNLKSDPLNNIPSDGDGPSYIFTGYVTAFENVTNRLGITKQVQFTGGVDEVWKYNRQIQLWKDAIAANEKAKVTSNDKINRSISAGVTETWSETTSRTESGYGTVNFSIDQSLALKIGAEIGGIGASATQTMSLSLQSNVQVGGGNEKFTTYSYTFDDQDPDDILSVDVYKANDGFGPIFRTIGGATSCPYEDERKTKHYLPGTTLDASTIQVEDPAIAASPSNVFNIPADGAANISLTLTNNGTADATYSLKVLESSNPHGAILKIDGINPNRDFSIPQGTSINKILTVEKGPSHIEYDNIKLILHSRCQFDFGAANYEDIADEVEISVRFLPSCTDLQVQSPQNLFIANTGFNQIIPIIISGYDINYSGLEKISLQYKRSNEPEVEFKSVQKEWFYNLTDAPLIHPDPEEISKLLPNISYSFDMTNLKDHDYDFRAISTCKIPLNPTHEQASPLVSGLIDRVEPTVFGTPSPADGVLDPNDDISIKFNEDIQSGILNDDNFEITGVLNGQAISHNIAIALNGTSSFMEIDNGFDFTSDDFTIEFWAKRNSIGTKQTIISQGSDLSNSFSIGFNSDNRIEVVSGSENDTSTFIVIDTVYWHHYSISYNKEKADLEIIERGANTSTPAHINNNFISEFNSGGKTYIGMSAINHSDYFDGSIHQLRIWNKALDDKQIVAKNGLNLKGREAGLIGYWPMEEGRGNLTEDKARFRHAEVHADWELNPKGNSVELNGLDQHVFVDSLSRLSITQEVDFTIEFWFKTTGSKIQSMFSNGSGRFESNDVNQNGWNIEMNAQNEIWVKNDSFAFKAVSQDYADDTWHHFALVVNRLALATAFIDGIENHSVSSSNFWGLSGNKLTLGARYYLNGTVENTDQFFEGGIDEVRIWNSALLKGNIELNMYNRLKGDEFGLLVYYPFESYRSELGVSILDTSLLNQSINLKNPNELNAIFSANDTLFSTISPPIALHRPVTKIKSQVVVNRDEIVINPIEVGDEEIENVALTVSVKDVEDLHGNTMASTKSWIAYVNKNQVLWQDAEKNLNKELNDTLTFTTKVVNSGGEVKNFTISNIPNWLSASQTSGSIDPLSTKTIVFTVNPGVNIGKYSEDIMLTTDFGFNEKLLVNLKVKKTPPAFSFDPNQYQYSMSIIGQIRINGKISSEEDDYLLAYMGNSLRGVAKLQYIESYDKYYAFLDVYSNRLDSLTFKVWNSTKGEIHIDVLPKLNFTPNQFIGSPSNPQIFDVEDNVQLDIVLNAGWNWVSLPILSKHIKNIDRLFKSVDFNEGDVIKTMGRNQTSLYGVGVGWMGRLGRKGLKLENSYLIKVAQQDTLTIRGLIVDPDTIPIQLLPGWNRIGFISQKNLQINSALANYNATEGDLIKSQQKFAYYDDQLGWIGSLQVLNPTEGLLLKTNDSVSFVYPRSGLLRLRGQEAMPEVYKSEPIISISNLSLNVSQYEDNSSAIIELDICEELINHEDFGLAAFYNDELRAWVSEATILDDQSHRYFMTLYGEGEEVFDFKLINSKTLEEFDLIGNVQFQKDKVEGTPAQPLHFYSLKEIDCSKYETTALIEPQLGGHLYPNPFTNELRIDIPTEFENEVVISLIDELGRVIHSEKVMDKKSIVWTTDNSNVSKLRPGIYYIQFKSEEEVYTEKVIKI